MRRNPDLLYSTKDSFTGQVVPAQCLFASTGRAHRIAIVPCSCCLEMLEFHQRYPNDALLVEVLWRRLFLADVYTLASTQ